MKRVVTDEQLKDIADAIRVKYADTMLGINLCDPNTLKCKALPNTKYTISMDVTWDGSAYNAGFVYFGPANGEQEELSFTNYLPKMEAGTTTRETTTITTQSTGDNIEIIIEPDSSLQTSNYQIQKGTVATSYTPYNPTLITFPDEFTSKILNIVQGVDTSSATATPSDIKAGKTAFSTAGTKLTGTYVPKISNTTISEIYVYDTVTIAAGSKATNTIVKQGDLPSGYVWLSNGPSYAETPFTLYGNSSASVQSYMKCRLTTTGNNSRIFDTYQLMFATGYNVQQRLNFDYFRINVSSSYQNNVLRII